MANMLHHYEGTMVGALVGDCLGAPFEFIRTADNEKTMNKIMKFFRSVDRGKKKGKCYYTDDTAMLRCVANSLVNQKKFDAMDLSKKFTEEFFEEPDRGYGGDIHRVFEQLRVSEFRDPFGPASAQFDGEGSYGNGGAMRIAPAALFGLHLSEKNFYELVTGITKITHSNTLAINGAILECSAVRIALLSRLSDVPITIDGMIVELIERMRQLEDGNEKPYCAKLLRIQEMLRQPSPPDIQTVVEELGNNVSALDSVPAAVFAFLHTINREPEGWEEEEELNVFQRTIIYAVCLGGDTDTIASMAGAIAGAYHGINCIPNEWQEACEKLDEAKGQAVHLYQLAEENRKTMSANIMCSIQ